MKRPPRLTRSQDRDSQPQLGCEISGRSPTAPEAKLPVADRRAYRVRLVADAKEIALTWLASINLGQVVKLGLPEIDDRHHVWRVPLRRASTHQNDRVGEIVIDAYSTEVIGDKTTHPDLIESRLLKRDVETDERRQRRAPNRCIPRSPLRNTIGEGDCRQLLDDMPAGSVDLVFTSPPYYNARPEYTEYEAYESYLDFMRQVIRKTHRVLAEGRFFVMNSAPVLVRRAHRNEASRRIAVPFDLHGIFIEEGFEFIDDIIWVKPEGAGWATGRGRRFAADRNPLQYKAVPVTEYVMVYRKSTTQLIDWNIRQHHDSSLVEHSKIGDDYEKTNIWKIQPATNSPHPAPFPRELAEKVITYYSFKDDVVLDPFAGSGTTAAAAARLSRRFVMFEINPAFVDLMRQSASDWLGREADGVLWINTPPAPPSMTLI